ncbi:MAG: hypothetical protein HYV35_05965 [Lentisphaerae bacterium]|nr:hypothetical protein [Lentisphaerota bacterium]
MKQFQKALAVIVVVLLFVAPLVALAHCEGDQATDCATQCACLCDCLPAFTCPEHASNLMTPKSERACSIVMLGQERVSVADIFRPPISA